MRRSRACLPRPSGRSESAGSRNDLLGRTEALEDVPDDGLVAGACLEQRVVDVLADLSDQLGAP